MRRRLGWFVGVLLMTSVIGCRSPTRKAAQAEPAVTTVIPSSDAGVASARRSALAVPVVATPLPPARVEKLLVPGDIVASIVRPPADAKRPPLTVFLAGLCSNANAYFHTFPEAARKVGGVVAIEGDQPCGTTGDFHSYSWDAQKQHLRIEAALGAAGVTEIPKEGITLVGYSQGAALAEQMVQRYPTRYARLVLIGAPTDPAPRNLARARSVVTMSCDRDVPSRMKLAAAGATKAGTPATYFEMPGCSHGNVTDGERIFDATFDFLHTNERPLDATAAPVRIVGSPSET
jgi:pimeloyl-ACP methyl ester carboxylesterase